MKNVFLRWAVRGAQSLCCATERKDNDKRTKLRLPLEGTHFPEDLQDFEYYCTVKVLKNGNNNNNSSSPDVSGDAVERMEQLEERMEATIAKFEKKISEEKTDGDLLSRFDALEGKIDALFARFGEQ